MTVVVVKVKAVMMMMMAVMWCDNLRLCCNVSGYSSDGSGMTLPPSPPW